MSHTLKHKQETKTSLTYLAVPDFGPLQINDYGEFLKISKEVFLEKWNSCGKPDKVEGTPVLLQDFKRLKVIGSGSFGKVYLVKNKLTKKYHAMKAISKETILKYKQLEHTRTEKLVLYSINCPFTVRLDFFFKDNSYIYFVLPFVQGGELFSHIRKLGKFDELSAMFYAAQVILALEYLHFVEIIYRDLKPENILIDHTGYIKLADFGFCKQLAKGRTYTLCGTPEYLAPEIILSKGYGKAVDWWGVGILTYELSAGFTPFEEKKAMKVYEKILKGSYKMPVHFSEDLKDLIRNILQADISKRFGNLKNGVEDFKIHKWFRPLNWQAVSSRQFTPPYCPKLAGPEDTSQFRPLVFDSLRVSNREKYPVEFADF